MQDSTGNCFEFESDFFSNSCTAGLVRPSYEVSKGGTSGLEKQNGKSFFLTVDCQTKDEDDDDDDTDKHIQKDVLCIINLSFNFKLLFNLSFFHSCDMFHTQSDFSCLFG